MNDEVDEVLRQLLKSINKRSESRPTAVNEAVRVIAGVIREVLQDRKWARDGNPREDLVYGPR